MNPTPRLAEGGARQRRKEARPQELLDAALALFVEKGYAATRTEEVAQLAGVSKGTLYLYYPSKEELLKAVIRHNLSSQIKAEGEELAGAPRGQFPSCLRDLFAHLVAAGLRQHRPRVCTRSCSPRCADSPRSRRSTRTRSSEPAARLLSGCDREQGHRAPASSAAR